MPRHYASFLIRCWRLESHEERIKVEHVQSGETTRLDSLEKLIAWMEQHWKELPGDGPPEPGQTSSSKEEGFSQKGVGDVNGRHSAL